MKPGDCINIPAEVKHWHGAAPDEWFSHLAIEVPGENSSNEWLEPVSDEEYRKLKIRSKVAAEHKTYEEAMAGINETLEKMGLDYLDMMIIHSPQPWAKVNQCEDRYVEGNRAAWKALEDVTDELKE